MPETYCTADDLDRFASADGITAFADHDQDGVSDAGVVSASIEIGSGLIDLYLSQWYEPSQLLGDRTINHWCIVASCRELCRHRYNSIPESLEAAYQEIFGAPDGRIHKLASGKLRIDASRRGGGVPTFSNLVIDRRHRHEKIRVVTQASSPEPTSRERDTYHGAGDYE